MKLLIYIISGGIIASSIVLWLTLRNHNPALIKSTRRTRIEKDSTGAPRHKHSHKHSPHHYRKYSKRNPTLAERDGLPPVRSVPRDPLNAN